MRNDTKLDVLWEEVEELKKSGGGGSGLPDVTSADNGDVLGVVNGAWSKISPVVNYTETEQKAGYTFLGSDVYFRTFVLPEDLTISYSELWTPTNIGGSVIDKIVDINVISSAGVYWGNVSASIIEDYVNLQTARNGDTITAKYVVLFYTKTPATKSKKKSTK